MRKLLSAAVIACGASFVSANQIIYDGFNYDATGTPVLGAASTGTAAFGVWTSQGTQDASGARLEPVVTAGSLTFPGMPSFGNSVMLNNTYGKTSPGADGSRLSLGTINSSDAPTLYFSFIASLPSSTNTSTGGAYFAGLDNLTAGTYTSFAGVFVRQDATVTTNLDLGIANSGSANKMWSATSYAPNMPLLIVGSFTFGGVATLDVFTGTDSIPASAPATHSATTTGNDASAVTQIKDFYVRGNVSEPQGILVDEVRVGTSWANILPVAGDTNFDGRIGADDYALIDRGFARYQAGTIAAGTAGWTDGDFNFDHAVDAGDYGIIDQALVNQGGALSPELLAERRAEFGEGYVAALSGAVPEPASIGMAGACVVGLLARRRRARAWAD